MDKRSAYAAGILFLMLAGGCASSGSLSPQINPYTKEAEPIAEEAFLRVEDGKGSFGNGFSIGDNLINTVLHWQDVSVKSRFIAWSGTGGNFSLRFHRSCPEWDHLLLKTEKEIPPLYLVTQPRRPRDNERLLAVSRDRLGKLVIRRGVGQSLGFPKLTEFGVIPEMFHIVGDRGITFERGNSGSAVFVESGATLDLIGYIDAKPAALDTEAFFILVSRRMIEDMYHGTEFSCVPPQ